MKLNKPKFWDIKKPSLLSHLLYPLTIPIQINNLILKYSKKMKFNKIKSICVGNIYVGGTGKTPLAIKLYNILKKSKKKIVIAKKFYSSQYDEHAVIRKYARLLLGKSRLDLINKALKNKYKIIIFDDGLQEKKIDYHLKFVCFDSLNWIGNGKILPSGPLRQKLEILREFDAVFLKTIGKANFKTTKLIKSINPKIKIFHTNLKIKNFKQKDLLSKYLIFSSIGDSNSFLNLLKNYKFNVIDQLTYPDHYKYDQNDIIQIIQQSKKQKIKILTTEKDYVKIPKKYQKKFNYIKLDLYIKNEKQLVKFINLKINEQS